MGKRFLYIICQVKDFESQLVIQNFVHRWQVKILVSGEIFVIDLLAGERFCASVGR